MLCGEGGLGETLQFVRYAPWLKRLGATVYLRVQPGLEALPAELVGGVLGVLDLLPHREDRADRRRRVRELARIEPPGDAQFARDTARELHQPLMRVYYSTDVVGVEVSAKTGAGMDVLPRPAMAMKTRLRATA